MLFLKLPFIISTFSYNKIWSSQCPELGGCPCPTGRLGDRPFVSLMLSMYTASLDPQPAPISLPCQGSQLWAGQGLAPFAEHARGVAQVTQLVGGTGLAVPAPYLDRGIQEAAQPPWGFARRGPALSWRPSGLGPLLGVPTSCLQSWTPRAWAGCQCRELAGGHTVGSRKCHCSWAGPQGWRAWT